MQLDPNDPLHDPRFWGDKELKRLAGIPGNPMDRSLEDWTWLKSQEQKVAKKLATFKAWEEVKVMDDDEVIEMINDEIEVAKGRPVTRAMIEVTQKGNIWLQIQLPPNTV